MRFYKDFRNIQWKSIIGKNRNGPPKSVWAHCGGQGSRTEGIRESFLPWVSIDLGHQVRNEAKVRNKARNTIEWIHFWSSTTYYDTGKIYFHTVLFCMNCKWMKIRILFQKAKGKWATIRLEIVKFVSIFWLFWFKKNVSRAYWVESKNLLKTMWMNRKKM